jgi:hypothetical protein
MAIILPPDIEAKLDGLKKSGDGWIARCPCHDDHNPSLSLTVTADGKVLAKCHAGCDQQQLVDELGLRSDTRDSDDEWTPRGPAIAVYDYRDESGALLFQVCRTADKEFPQRRPDPTAKTGWRWSLGETRRVLFRLPELVAAASEGQSVCIAEGEKDALALVRAGRVATCNPGGAGKWRPDYAAFFTDLDVTIFADKDTVGQGHARTVAATLEGVAKRVWIVEAADPHKDIAAHLAADLPLSAVQVTKDPDRVATPDLAPDIHEFLAEQETENDWLIPGLLERGERLMLTGFEGLGKSMLNRQIAVCLAAGLNPFTLSARGCRPVNVLVVDCENSARQNRRHYRPMVEQAAIDGYPIPTGGLRLIHRPEGIDLTRDDDAAWLLERVTAHRPDALFIGPLYRLHAQNMNDELAARKMVGVIDLARVTAMCAVVIEAHAGHGEFGRNRSVRPVGSSLFLRWPEFGYGLRPFEDTSEKRHSPLELQAWRGPRDERSWPTYLEHDVDTGWAWREHVRYVDLKLVR